MSRSDADLRETYEGTNTADLLTCLSRSDADLLNLNNQRFISRRSARPTGESKRTSFIRWGGQRDSDEKGLTGELMTSSRERLIATLNHKQPDRIPIDFGGTAVTGIHVSCVAALRDHFGLEKRPVKVHEPFQMLGLLDEDLKQALGIDVEGVFRRRTMFGFEIKDWKPWDFNGLEVLVPGMFNTTVDAKGDTLIYPQGDLAAGPSGRMPRGFHFFDAIIRQHHLDDDNLNVEDNLEEFQPIGEADLASIKADVDAARSTGRALIAAFGGTALGDIALVPAPFLKDPRGIRDIGEWYMSLKSRRDYIHGIYERQTEIALGNLARIHQTIGNAI